MGMSNYEKQKRWREKHRALYNLQQRNRRKKNLGLGEQEPKAEATVPGIEMESQDLTSGSSKAEEHHGTRAKHEDVGSTPTPKTPFATKKVGEFRMIVLPEEKPTADAPESTDTRSRSDIAMGIWRNDQGGVISKFAYDKLQKMKEHAKEKEFEIDEYSQ